MEIKLLTRDHKGMFISCHKHGLFLYFHFPRVTHRICFSRGRVWRDKYSTVGFNRQVRLEAEEPAPSSSTNKQMVAALDDIRAIVFGHVDSVTKVRKVQDLITRLNTGERK